MDYLSCVPDRVYRDGGFFEPATQLAVLEGISRLVGDHCEFVRELFPPYRYTRPPADMIIGGSAAFQASLLQHYELYNRDVTQGAATVLVRLRDTFVHGNVLYADTDRGFLTVYESHRPNDRPYVPLIDRAAAHAAIQPAPDTHAVNLFVGSAGSSNYGHWLIDDLPRMQAVHDLRRAFPERLVRIWITSYGGQLDHVRINSIQHVCRGIPRLEVGILRSGDIRRFDELYYVTPTSYHPLLKSPESLAFVRNTIHSPDDTPRSSRIYVTRRADRSRVLLNEAEVQRVLAGHGFVPVDVEDMSFIEQVHAFAAASLIVGSMGAAMTNCIFAPDRARTMYLCPDGWIEPFFWDMAAVRRQRYLACYGAVEPSELPPHLSSFRVSVPDLEIALQTLLSDHPAG